MKQSEIIAMHCAGATLMTAVLLAGDHLWGGGWSWLLCAMPGATFFYAREVSQAQTEEAKLRGVYRSDLWYYGLVPWQWQTIYSRLQGLLPAFLSYAMATAYKLLHI